MVGGGSNGNDTQAYLKVLTLRSVHAKFQLGITICRFGQLFWIEQPHYKPQSSNYVYCMFKHRDMV